ncbi:nucleotide exchange factor sil1 [Podila clonocystis]|nr:nucleotide exchange factor sil1 [Podila clonocystis]
MARFTSKLTLVIGLCAALALAKAANVDNRPPVICDKGYCYPRVFRPTYEFQEVLEGQEIPGGLHVQMDFETHRKYAKLMDPEEAQVKDSNSILVVDTDSPGVYQHEVGNSNSNMPPPIDLHTNDEEQASQIESSRLNLQTAFDSIPELGNIEQDAEEVAVPKDNTPYDFPPSNNRQYFNEQLEIVRSSNDNDDVLEALEALADIASDMEFGLLLAEKDGLRVLQKRLFCQDEASCQDGRLIRAKAAVVISASLQNYNAAQEQAYKSNLHKVLLARLENEKDERVIVRLMSAYTNLVRGGNGKIREQDVVPLANIFSQHSNPTIRQRFVFLVSDYVDPQMQYVPSANGKEEKTKTKLEVPKLNVGPWCQALQTLDTESGVEEVDRALELLNAYNPDSCPLPRNSSREDL